MGVRRFQQFIINTNTNNTSECKGQKKNKYFPITFSNKSAMKVSEMSLDYFLQENHIETNKKRN